MPSPSFHQTQTETQKAHFIEIESGTGPLKAIDSFHQCSASLPRQKSLPSAAAACRCCGAWSRTEWILVRFEGRRVACSTFLQGQSKRNSPDRWTFPLLTLVLD